MKRIVPAMMLAAAICCLPSVSRAATVLVPDDQATIQAAIDATDGNDTVLVRDGVYSGTGFFDLVIPDTTIVIRSENGSSSTTIDCEGPVPGDHVAFILGHGGVGTGRDISVTIEGFTITNGVGGGYGGAITGDAWELVIRDCVFRTNRAINGGAVSCVDCEARVFSSRFALNVANDSGGAIYGIDDGYIFNTRFDSNMADVGGALAASDTIRFESCAFNANQSPWGSVMHPTPGGTGFVYMSGCLIYRNRGSAAFYMPPGTTGEYRNCTIYGNEGAFELHTADVTLTDCILAQNAEKPVVCFDQATAPFSDPYLTYCCVDDEGLDFAGCKESFYFMPNNLIADPLFCDTANNDFRLGSTSPCVGIASDGGNIGAVGVGCFPTDVDDDDGPSLPDDFAVRQNYPNPFNAGTMIEYTLPRATTVTLSIYSIDGRLVRQMVWEHQSAGVHQIEWDGNDASGDAVASGVYLYRLEAGADSDSRKMLLVK